MPPALPSNVEFDAREQLLRAKFRGPFVGLDTTSSIANMDMLALRIADNCDIEDNGTITKRKGYTPILDSVWGTYTIFQGLEFKHSSTVDVLLAGRDSLGSTGAFGKVQSTFAGVTDIVTGLDVQRPSLFSFGNLAFYLNGADDFLYDGTGAVSPAERRQIGITAPASAPGLTSNTNGSLTVGATYSVVYTYYNANTGAESSPSLPTSVTILADPNDGITVTYLDGNPTTATHVNFYRTTATGAVLLFDKTVVLGSTSTTLTQGDAGLGRQLEEDHTPPGTWGFFKYGWVSENRVHLTGLSDNPNRVHVSAITATGPHPEAYPVTNFTDCQSSHGELDYNLGGGVAGQKTIILKTKSIGTVERFGVDGDTTSGDNVIFYYKELSRAVTGLSHFGACHVFGEYVWLGQDNIYATDGENVRSVGDNIRNDIVNFQLTPNDLVSAFNDLKKQRVYFSCKSNPSLTQPDIVIVGKYRKVNIADADNSTLVKERVEFSWTYYKKGSNTTTHPGIFAGCFFETGQFDGVRRVLWGNTKLTGKLYQMNDGNNDDTAAIDFKIRFGPVSYGMDEEEKLYIKDIVTMCGNGGNYTATFASVYEFSETVLEIEEVSLYTGVDLWNGTTWNGGLWSSASAFPEKKMHNCHFKAFHKQLQISNANADEPITILNYQTMARPIAWRG